ncbi:MULTISPECIES: STAS domain-containing protein [Prauserella salsuginis group]|uniref:Anti-sigma factor antagonist n=1 Tax=Prauserella salsuginis TaxID=387889 RepID=A0ABW6G5A4_9PSEU|nr:MULTISPECIES: STAS domain-containing protein [Prauserella salsuginis group]MCR3718937.1 anti-anti-sigma factor [Prauserella flava]MCR3733507.1 anti-anti-sigma factor [Prauserella salsuginis]
MRPSHSQDSGPLTGLTSGPSGAGDPAFGPALTPAGTPHEQTGPVDTVGTSGMRIEAERRADGIVHARVSGELDLLSAPDLRKWIHEELPAPARLVLDLDGVDFLGSAGLSVLAELSEQAAGDQLNWAIVASTRVVLRPLEATGLAEQIPVHAGVDSAVSAV